MIVKARRQSIVLEVLRLDTNADFMDMDLRRGKK